MLIQLDQKLRIADVDGSMLSLLNLGKEEVVNSKLQALLHEDVPNILIDDFCESIKEGRKYSSIIKFAGADNKDRWLAFESNVISDIDSESAVILRLYSIDDEVEFLTQTLYDDMSETNIH